MLSKSEKKKIETIESDIDSIEQKISDLKGYNNQHSQMIKDWISYTNEELIKNFNKVNDTNLTLNRVQSEIFSLKDVTTDVYKKQDKTVKLMNTHVSKKANDENLRYVLIIYTFENYLPQVSSIGNYVFTSIHISNYQEEFYEGDYIIYLQTPEIFNTKYLMEKIKSGKNYVSFNSEKCSAIIYDINSRIPQTVKLNEKMNLIMNSFYFNKIKKSLFYKKEIDFSNFSSYKQPAFLLPENYAKFSCFYLITNETNNELLANICKLTTFDNIKNIYFIGAIDDEVRTYVKNISNLKVFDELELKDVAQYCFFYNSSCTYNDVFFEYVAKTLYSSKKEFGFLYNGSNQLHNLNICLERIVATKDSISKYLTSEGLLRLVLTINSDNTFIIPFTEPCKWYPPMDLSTLCEALSSLKPEKVNQKMLVHYYKILKKEYLNFTQHNIIEMFMEFEHLHIHFSNLYDFSGLNNIEKNIAHTKFEDLPLLIKARNESNILFLNDRYYYCDNRGRVISNYGNSIKEVVKISCIGKKYIVSLKLINDLKLLGKYKGITTENSFYVECEQEDNISFLIKNQEGYVQKSFSVWACI